MPNPERINSLEQWSCTVLEDPADEPGMFVVRALDNLHGGSFITELSIDELEEKDKHEIEPGHHGAVFHWHQDELIYPDGSEEVVATFCFPRLRPLTAEEEAEAQRAGEEFVRLVHEAFGES